jgi:hypothetical protein
MGPEVGMPNVVVNDLQLNPATSRLLAFTYGRGAFALVNATNATDLSFTSVARSGNDILLTFKTIIGRGYAVQGADNMPAGVNWYQIATNVPGTGNPVTVRDVGGVLHPKRFYRALATP